MKYKLLILVLMLIVTFSSSAIAISDLAIGDYSDNNKYIVRDLIPYGMAPSDFPFYLGARIESLVNTDFYTSNPYELILYTVHGNMQAFDVKPYRGPFTGAAHPYFKRASNITISVVNGFFWRIELHYGSWSSYYTIIKYLKNSNVVITKSYVEGIIEISEFYHTKDKNTIKIIVIHLKDRPKYDSDTTIIYYHEQLGNVVEAVHTQQMKELEELTKQLQNKNK